MEFNNDQPIYIQIANYLKHMIIRGELGPGDQVPSVRQIASLLTVNPNTVQRAFQLLRDEGIFYAQRGLGSFVTEDVDLIDRMKDDMALDIFKTFIEEIDSIGLSKERTLELLKNYWEEYYDQD